ncbi:MAG: hypothetical protein HQK56_16175 [Deltaproteobacteria bacterium]|nr:hypothetical protein [Deltaproteobacteria bacterium]
MPTPSSLMDDKVEELARSVIAAIRQITDGKQSLNSRTLATHLAKIETVRSLLGAEATPGMTTGGLELADSSDAARLEKRYNELFKRFRALDERSLKLEEAVLEVTSVLSSLAKMGEVRHLEDLITEIKNRIQAKAGPEELLDAIHSIKTALLQTGVGDSPAEDKPKKKSLFGALFGRSKKTEEEEEAGPLEEEKPHGQMAELEMVIKDILVSIIKNLADHENQEVRKKTAAVILEINNNFSVQDYGRFVQHINDLFADFKDSINQERQKLASTLKEVMETLYETEAEFIRTMRQSGDDFISHEVNFQNDIHEKMDDIEGCFSQDLSIEGLKDRIINKVAEIRGAFKKKRDEEETKYRLEQKRVKILEKRLKQTQGRLETVKESTKKFKKKQTSIKNSP